MFQHNTLTFDTKFKSHNTQHSHKFLKDLSFENKKKITTFRICKKMRSYLERNSSYVK